VRGTEVPKAVARQRVARTRAGVAKGDGCCQSPAAMALRS
jgi:hypothetical protein